MINTFNILSKIPSDVISLVELFYNNNFKIYLVGGSLRDYYLGKIPSDFDFATSALPDEIIELLSEYKIFDIGKKYGTIGVRFHSIVCEITTFRSEAIYLDCRHPSNVVFQSDIVRDLERRDFSINAMAYDLKSNILIDLFNGIRDIKSKQICCVGDADMRFKEDALRILRAFSFSSRLGFNLKEQTLQAAIKHKNLLKHIADERINIEIDKILQGKNVQNVLKLLKQYEILNIKFIPKKVTKIPQDIRTFSSFLIFEDFISKKDMNIVQDIFIRLKLHKKISQRMEFFASLSSKFSIKHIMIAIYIKQSISKKYRLLKKGIYIRGLKQKLNINGFDILSLGFNKYEIKSIKEILLVKIYSKQLPNNKRILQKYIKLHLVK